MATTVRDKIVAQARQWLGTPYVWGGESASEGGVDCSGLIIATYRDAGVPLTGRPIASQLGLMGTSVPISQAKPGDVVYYDRPGSTDHVGVYIGDGKMINAPTVGQPVRVDSVGSFSSIRRILAGDVDSGSARTLTGDESASDTPWYDPNYKSENADAGIDLTEIGGDFFDWLNPFDDWARDGMNMGLKLLATGMAGALVIAGAVKLVS